MNTALKILHIDSNHPLLMEQLQELGFINHEDFNSSKEEIEAKKLLQLEKAKHMRSLLKEKRENLRRDNPNYEIEKKERQKELHRIACKKYDEKKKALKNKSGLENSV